MHLEHVYPSLYFTPRNPFSFSHAHTLNTANTPFLWSLFFFSYFPLCQVSAASCGILTGLVDLNWVDHNCSESMDGMTISYHFILPSCPLALIFLSPSVIFSLLGQEWVWWYC